jgi:predicted nucleic acid-binding protein
MARQTLVLDASVGVKWFSDKGESSLVNALAIREAHSDENILIVVPDFFYYEVANAIVQKKFIPADAVQSVVAAMFALRLRTAPVDADLLVNAVNISRQFNITVYDSCYIAVAQSLNCPLITANPHHQKQDLGCRIIPIDQWGGDLK